METAPHELSKEKRIAELKKKKAELYKIGAKFIVILLSLVCVLIGFIFLINNFIAELSNVEVYEGQSNQSSRFTVEFGPVEILIMMTILLSSIWAGNDSSKIEFEKYKSTISNGPFMITLGCLALWIVIFPWYLIQRSKIISGTAELKEPE